jgi:hypothetical protein
MTNFTTPDSPPKRGLASNPLQWRGVGVGSFWKLREAKLEMSPYLRNRDLLNFGGALMKDGISRILNGAVK